MTSLEAQKAQLWAILAIVLFGFLGLSMPYLTFPSLFLNSDYGLLPPSWSEADRGLALGVTLAAYPFGQFFGSPILGALSDDYGRRKTMAFTLIVASICSLFSAYALVWKELWVLIGSRFAAGLMEGNLAIARSMAADLKGLSKHETFGKINAATSVGYVVGPLIGGVLSDKTVNPNLSSSTPFFVISLLFFLLSIVSLLVLKERPRPITGPFRSFGERINFVARLRVLCQNTTLKWLLGVVTLHTIAVDIFYEFGPVFLTAEWGLGPAELALYNAVLSISLTVGGAFVAGWLAERYPDRRILFWSMLTMTVELSIMPITSLPVGMTTLFILLGLSISVTTTNLTVQVSDAVSDKIQGEVMGVQTSLRVLGDTVICLAGGTMLAVSPALVLVVAALLSLYSLVLYHRSN